MRPDQDNTPLCSHGAAQHYSDCGRHFLREKPCLSDGAAAAGSSVRSRGSERPPAGQAADRGGGHTGGRPSANITASVAFSSG